MFAKGPARSIVRGGAAAGVLLALAACAAPGTGSGAGSTAGATMAATAATAGAATSPPATSAGASVPAATTAGGGTAMVDLTFTGTFDFAAKGTAGRCIVVGGHFGFEGTEADYPGLGLSFSMAELNPGYVDIKWIKDDDNNWGNDVNAKIALTADHKGVTLDQDLSPFTNMSTGESAGPEHVKGTVTCP